MARRSIVLVTVVGLALALAATALGATVTVRVEGKTQPIFGSVPVKVDAPNALVALDVASTLGEFYAQVTQSSFGTVRQPDRPLSRGRDAGWVFKVNGVSPPVGADQVTLKDGDEVLWYYATFSDTGGPQTLALKAAAANCYTVSSFDDAGKAPPRPVRSVRSTGGGSRRARTAGPVSASTRARPRLRRRRGPVERREVSSRARIVPLLAALALAGCGGEGPTAADGTARLWVTRDRGSEVLVDTPCPPGRRCCAR